jgi:hypothetical protein
MGNILVKCEFGCYFLILKSPDVALCVSQDVTLCHYLNVRTKETHNSTITQFHVG